ncbi:MAG TPA: isocitrate/isopropylmalate family dehydrogenase [Sphingomicrobium sp.]
MLSQLVASPGVSAAAREGMRLSECLVTPMPRFDVEQEHHIGVFLGEGVGPEVVPVAIELLNLLASRSSRRICLSTGGLIGVPAKQLCGSSLSPEVIEFAQDIFDRNGALFCGPGGDRFVYEIRRKFELYCKFTPIEPLPELRQSGQVRPEVVATADMIAIREGMGGIYQGSWEEVDIEDDRVARHRFEYKESMVRRIVTVAINLAKRRRGRIHVVLKPGGIPSISSMWRRVAEEMASEAGIFMAELEIDNAVFQLIANPGQFDVVLSPNMFGDVLADCAALLLASRGLSYSGNYNDRGNGVYQTGHGAARDIAGKDVANPIGQVLSLGMMLRENFSWPEADQALRAAVRGTLSAGYCTADIAAPGSKTVGTRSFGTHLREQLELVLAQQDV